MLVWHSLCYVIGRGTAAIISVIALMIYTRLVPPENYGSYALGMAAALLMNAGLFHWLRVSMNRFIPVERQSTLLGTVMAAYLCLGILVLVAGAGIFLTGQADGLGGEGLVLAVVCLCLSHGWYELCLEVESNHLSPQRYGFISIIRAVLALLMGTAGLLWLGGQAIILLYTLAAAQFLATLPTILRYGRSFVAGFDAACWARLWHFGWPLIFAFIMVSANTNVDRLLIGGLAGKEAAAHYAVATDLAKQVILILVQSVAVAAYPLVVRKLEAEGKDAAHEQLRENFNLIALVSFTLLTLLLVLKDDLIFTVLGESFQQDALQIFPAAVVGTFCLVWRGFYFDQTLQLAHRTRAQIFINAAVLLLLVGLNLLWLPEYNIRGAAWAYVAAHATGLCISIVWARRAFSTPVQWDTILKMIMAGFLVIIAMKFMPDPSDLPVINLLCRGSVAGIVLLALYIFMDAGRIRTLVRKSRITE